MSVHHFDLDESHYEANWLEGKPDSIVILISPEHFNGLSDSKTTSRNFSDLNIMFTKNSFYKSAVKAMKTQQSDEQKIIDRFLKLTQLKGYHNYSEKQIQEFKSDYQFNILGLYAQQTFFYKVLNRILRESQTLSEIFYVQPFIKKMYEQIKYAYQGYTKREHRSFVCYRGGKMSSEQKKYYKENKGCYVQSYGFLSTSLQRSIAQDFKVNIIFKITVRDEERDEQTDGGYIFMNKFVNEQFKNEEQVLFNALSSFKIVDVHEEESLIELEYGEGPRLRNAFIKNQNYILSKDSTLQILLTQNIMIPSNQKNVLFNDLANLQYFQMVMKIFLKILEQNFQKNQINKFNILQIDAALLIYYLLFKMNTKAIEIYAKFQNYQTISYPSMVDKFIEQEKIKKICQRYHPITCFMLKIGSVGLYHFFTGDFVMALEISQRLELYLQWLSILNPQLIPKTKIYSSYFMCNAICKAFSLCLLGQTKEAKIYLQKIFKTFNCHRFYFIQGQIILAIYKQIFGEPIKGALLLFSVYDLEKSKSKIIEAGFGRVYFKIIETFKRYNQTEKLRLRFLNLSERKMDNEIVRLCEQKFTQYSVKTDRILLLLYIVKASPFHISRLQNIDKIPTIEKYKKIVHSNENSFCSRSLIQLATEAINLKKQEADPQRRKEQNQMIIQILNLLKVKQYDYANAILLSFQTQKNENFQKGCQLILNFMSDMITEKLANNELFDVVGLTKLSQTIIKKFSVFKQVKHLQVLNRYILDRQELLKSEFSEYVLQRVGHMMQLNPYSAVKQLQAFSVRFSKQLGETSWLCVLSQCYLLNGLRFIGAYEEASNIQEQIIEKVVNIKGQLKSLSSLIDL